ncbi:MAG TPA: condensation domain-containing protein, partial [Gemmatimonadales bacterium]|nr:condensation domain-containing protein [Gemmatimonadales bacterium]
DGWSEEVFSRELTLLYQALREGKPNPLPPLTVQYADFALWQREWLEAEVSSGLAYWRQQLAGLPERLELPTDRPRPPLQTFAAAVWQTRLTAAQVAALKQLSRSHQTTLYMTLLALFTLLLQRYSGQEDIVVGSPIANRQEAQVESLIGFFVNTLCLRVSVQPELSFAELLAQVRRTALAAYEHQDVPFERLVEELSPPRSLNTTPLFQVSFVLQNAPRVTEPVPGLELESLSGAELRVRYDLELHAWEEQDQIGLGWLYNRDLFDGWRMEQMARHYLRLLEVVAVAPEQRLGSIDLLDAEERHLLLTQYNDTARELPAATLPQLFEVQVRSTPHAVALVCDSQHLSYAQLNRRANQIARYLRRAGVKVGELVGICLDHSFEELAALLGVLKAGAAYLPLAPDQPPPRLSFMLADAGVKLVLTQQSFAAARLAGATRLLCLDSEWSLIAKESDSNLNLELPVESIAYVIYTSGSTGEPKGVAVPHRALVNYSCWAKDTYLRGEQLAFPLYSSLAFD